MRKVKIKSLIFGYLANAGEPRNTIEICEWINKNDKNGTSTKQIGPILSREPIFVKVGTEKVSAFLGGSYRVKLWALRDYSYDECKDPQE